MPVQSRRRLRLPADHRSPAAARAAVRAVLAEAGLNDLLDEAVLLTTELSTNGVVHAGTDLDVEVVADDTGVTVTVTDFRGGPLGAQFLRSGAADERPDNETGGELAEGGRGLLLVDQFASSWGTTHDPNGKAIWFRLVRPGAPTAATRGPGPGPAARPGPRPSGSPAPTDTAAPDRRSPAGDAYGWLVDIPDELRARMSADQLAAELLARLCEVLAAEGGEVWLDAGDGHGAQRIARQGDEPAGVPDHDIPLPLDRPLRGGIRLFGLRSPSDDWETLGRLSAERMALAIEMDRLHDTDRRRRGWLAYVAEASDLLAQSLDVDLTLALVPQIVVPRLGEWCAVHMAGEWGDLELATWSHVDEGSYALLKRLLGGSGHAGEVISRLREAMTTRAPVTLPGPVDGVAVPLIARGEVLGTLAVGRPPDRLHGPDDVALIEDVARRASLAIDNARIHADREEVAQAFQRALLPAALPIAPGIAFGAEYVPASSGTDVGGDFYDVTELDDDTWLVAIGDVCGKGAQAAALTGLVRDVVRVLVTDHRPLPRALELLNDTLVARTDGRYATVAVALVSRAADGCLDARLCLAGHDKPVLVHPDGRAEIVGRGGTAVGLVDTVRMPETTVRLAPGDVLIFYTDGVTERRRGQELYGRERLVAEAAGMAGLPAGVAAARIRRAALAFSPDPPRDDIAVLVLRNEG